MKIQPINNDFPANRDLPRAESSSSSKPVLKSRLKRLLDRPFTRSSNSEKSLIDGTEFEQSLAKMVQSYMEENNDKQTKTGRNNHRCNCFNGNNDSSDDEFDFFDGFVDSFNDAYDHYKSLIPCASVVEKNLLNEAMKITEKSKSVKRKDELRKIVVDELSSLGYDSSICKSKWDKDKSRSIPAGEYEFIDVIVNGERFLIDVDFRSEFEIARQTIGYKALLQSLPLIFVGKSDRIRQIVSMVSEAAKQSLKKKGMHFPPWRKADYMRAKWLSSYTRISSVGEDPSPVNSDATAVAEPELLVFEEKLLSPPPLKSSSSLIITSVGRDDDDDVAVLVKREAKGVTGLALLFKEKP
ncbi:hypothetical protein CARUB_v10005138mg [Capsella rubella]|uniref:DUF506 domain-containing protein n=1 Tax=Capsella rubella TaxID=81985 RepID=R0GX65_9BRAS|nr:uncharacterized protein LOC17878204 [Capsella rubella]EOA16915.1 hypothetical protein CARUB_v10005138mg [Capsella rubella]